MNKQALTFISRIKKELLELKQVVQRATEAWRRAQLSNVIFILIPSR